MISQSEYITYFGVDTTPSNFQRLETVAISELRSIMTQNIPTKDDLVYKEFIKALMEEMNYLDMNSDLINSGSAGGYTLGSYHEGSNQNNNSQSINRVSPVAYDILLTAGLLYPGLGSRC